MSWANSEAETIRKQVQGFYRWYAPRAAKEPMYEKALKERSSLFAPPLLKALREDLKAQAKVKDEIVGLDFDPFLNSQDPESRYAVTRVEKNGRAYTAEVHSKSVALTVVLHKSKSGWQFANFLYGKGQDLIGILKELKRERGGTHRT